jgi:tetratricopeptide (TPR) repeat protein
MQQQKQGKKQISRKKPAPKPAQRSRGASSNQHDPLGFVNDRFMLVLTLFVAAAYYIYSAVSEGMYQHDEAGHFINMRSFWHDPNVILGNWPKVGYKLIYAIPSLFGEGVVTIVNCLFAAFTAYFGYKVVRQLGGRFALLAFVLIASQPMWVQLSFRHYSEIITAFLIVLSLYFLFNKKLILAAFIISYITLIRQEFYVILGIFGIYLLVQRNFRAILVAAIPPVLYNVWGWIASGEPFYLVTQVLNTSSAYGGAYPRQGFDHYPLLAESIFGIVAIMLFFVYAGTKIMNWKKVNWFILIPAVLFFLMHCIFNSKSLDFGPSSGGNHRYMAVITPLLAILGALSLDEVLQMKRRYLVLVVVVPVLFIAGYFWSFEPDGIFLGDIRDWRPLIVGSLVGALLIIPVRNTAIITATLVLLAIFNTVTSIQPIPNSTENETMEEVVKWYQMEVRRERPLVPSGIGIDENTQIYTNHSLFFYYQDKTAYDFVNRSYRITIERIDTASIGALILWDSHYSYRPNLRDNSLNDEYFLDRPHEFTLINTFTSDNRFNVKAFLKTGKEDKAFNQALDLYQRKEYTEALEYFMESVKTHPENYVSYYYAGTIFQEQQKYNDALTHYNRALQINPDYSKALIARGRLWSLARRFNESMIDVNRFIELNPNDASGYFTRGGIYYSLDQFEEAIRDYAVVVKLAPNFAQTYYNVGLAQIKLNQNQSACANFARAKELGYEQAGEALKQYCGD